VEEQMVLSASARVRWRIWRYLTSNEKDVKTDNFKCAGEGTNTGNIVQILLGLAKSYFNVKGKSNPAIQVYKWRKLNN
jgi:hypothetical protein